VDGREQNHRGPCSDTADRQAVLRDRRAVPKRRSRAEAALFSGGFPSEDAARLREKGQTSTRITARMNENGEEIAFMTNLESEFPGTGIAELYLKRWEIKKTQYAKEQFEV
jgi:hypothetical protein